MDPIFTSTLASLASKKSVDQSLYVCVFVFVCERESWRARMRQIMRLETLDGGVVGTMCAHYISHI